MVRTALWQIFAEAEDRAAAWYLANPTPGTVSKSRSYKCAQWGTQNSWVLSYPLNSHLPGKPFPFQSREAEWYLAVWAALLMALLCDLRQVTKLLVPKLLSHRSCISGKRMQLIHQHTYRDNEVALRKTGEFRTTKLQDRNTDYLKCVSALSQAVCGQAHPCITMWGQSKCMNTTGQHCTTQTDNTFTSVTACFLVPTENILLLTLYMHVHSWVLLIYCTHTHCACPFLTPTQMPLQCP